MSDILSDSSFYEGLPVDPELAFLFLEERFNADVKRALRDAPEDYFPTGEYLQYISRTLSARTELGLDILEDWHLPHAGDFNADVYNNFKRDVDHFRTAFQIRHARRAEGHSVRFDATTKRKIHFYLDQVREIIEKAEIGVTKKEILSKRLHDLEIEVDRDRTRFVMWAEFAIATAGVAGEAAEKLKPIKELMDSVAELIWGAKEQERARLPSPADRKQIEGPKRSEPPSALRRKELDDEVPF